MEKHQKKGENHFWQNRMYICEGIIRENMYWIVSMIRDFRGDRGNDYKIRMKELPENIDDISVVELRNGVGIQMLLMRRTFSRLPHGRRMSVSDVGEIRNDQIVISELN